MKTKTAKASEIAEALALSYTQCETEAERTRMAALARAIGELVTNDAGLFVAEVEWRAGKHYAAEKEPMTPA